jgi:hypothetical protein
MSLFVAKFETYEQNHGKLLGTHSQFCETFYENSNTLLIYGCLVSGR